MTHLPQFIDLLKKSLEDNTFIKLSLGNYKGNTEGLKQVYIKKIQIKQEDKLSFTYRYQTKDIVKNYSYSEGIAIIKDCLGYNAFRVATLFNTEYDALIECVNQDKVTLKKNKPTQTQLPSFRT